MIARLTDPRSRTTERPWHTARMIGRVALPWPLAAYIVYVLLWYLPFKFYPDSHLFQVLRTPSVCPGSSRISATLPAGWRQLLVCCW